MDISRTMPTSDLTTPPPQDNDPRESPASGSNIGERCKINTDKGGKKITFFLPRSSPPKNKLTCSTCSRTFFKPGSLAHRVKACTSAESNRRKCKWCTTEFASFPAVRNHERKAHTAEYQKDLEKKLPMPENEILSKLAEIEANTLKGVPFMAKWPKR